MPKQYAVLRTSDIIGMLTLEDTENTDKAAKETNVSQGMVYIASDHTNHIRALGSYTVLIGDDTMDVDVSGPSSVKKTKRTGGRNHGRETHRVQKRRGGRKSITFRKRRP